MGFSLAKVLRIFDSLKGAVAILLLPPLSVCPPDRQRTVDKELVPCAC